MSRERETNLALFVDFDNVALGARDARQRFDVKLLLQRVLEKGKIIVKRAYADWHYYKEHMSPLHEAAIELIEIPMPRISGKNSADIKLVVDAMDLCYSKDHIDTFVIVSGDSDFSPLVSKLRENNKRVIGIGVKNSSSKLLINNCDEFIFYDDIYRDAVGPVTRKVTNVPADKRDLFDFLVATAQSLLQESRGVLYSSLVKDTMTRKQPDFNERNFGYSNFGELLDEARRLGLLIVERDARAGGTWVVQGLGEEEAKESKETTPAPGTGTSRSSRRRRSRGRGRGGDRDKVTQDGEGGEGIEPQADSPTAKSSEDTPETKTPVKDKIPRSETSQSDGRKADEQKSEAQPDAIKKPAPRRAPQKKVVTAKAPAKKAPTKKVAAKKAPTKKTTAKKTGTKKVTTKKAPAKKAPAQNTPTKKAPTKKVSTKKSPTKKAPAKKTTTKKAVSKKTPTKKAVTKKAPARKTTSKKPVRKKSSD